MRSKKLLLLVLVLCMAMMLCACNKDEADQTPDALGTADTQTLSTSGTPQGQQTPTPQQTSGSTVDFNLQQAPDPNFSSPESGGSDDKIYTIQGDYAYEMDPNTLQIIGPPLDPITHEPVDNPVLDGSNPSTPNNPQDTATPVDNLPEDPVDTPTPTEPPKEDNKLPNTGMFLEDD